MQSLDAYKLHGSCSNTFSCCSFVYNTERLHTLIMCSIATTNATTGLARITVIYGVWWEGPWLLRVKLPAFPKRCVTPQGYKCIIVHINLAWTLVEICIHNNNNIILYFYHLYNVMGIDERTDVYHGDDHVSRIYYYIGIGTARSVHTVICCIRCMCITCMTTKKKL